MFCYKCADQFYPLPNHNLTAPVRVCYTCKQMIESKQQNSLSSSSSKQELTNEQQLQKQFEFFSNPIKSESFSIKPSNHQQQQQEFLQKFSYSPSSLNSFPSSLYSNQQQQHSFSKPIQNTASSSCSLGSRCNQLDSNKFKKNGTKTQKVSV